MILYIFRGLPGSGKSSVSKDLRLLTISADDYFDEYCGGVFDSTQLSLAHNWCRNEVEYYMKFKQVVAVANTFTQEWEIKPYLDLADLYGYKAYSLIVENRHGNQSVHNVPETTITKMRNRFSTKL